jgi:hypothetical protein
MKQTIQLFAALLLLQQSAMAQAPVTDTVSLGTGYANQVWYSLQNGEQGSAPKNNWDIAFDLSAYGASVLANTVTGTKVWLYAAGDTADWSTLDTTGLSTWPAKYNSDTSWALGAFSQGQSSAFDMGWGMYNSITHYVDGDSLYVVKLPDNSWRKLWIVRLANGMYTFRYATLDNSSDQLVVLDKANYTGKNFVYYSLQNNSAIDREPLGASWDLLFTQYTGFIPQPYTVAGVLANNGVTVAEARGVDVNNVFYTGYTFATAINEIGYDWKAFTSSWTIEDSLVYFVQTVPGDVWKVVFTGFSGSSTGNYIFTKELISPASVHEEDAGAIKTLYPNPAAENATLVFSTATDLPVTITVTDFSGKTVYASTTGVTRGLQQHVLPANEWAPGMYIVSLQADGKTAFSKLVVQ